jgi:hypothetical protein
MQNITKPVTCYSKVRGWDWQQEIYESASRDAGRRAKQLRKLGFTITTSPMGLQVTRVGLVKLTMLNVHHPEAREIPDPDRIERL